MDITPTPTDEEVAAISAAIGMALASQGGGASVNEPKPPYWRFSGRWWYRPAAIARQRPWRG